MRVGTSQFDITPEPGIDLVGFAVRPQPSTGRLDRLDVRGLYLEDDSERLLWLHADVLAVEDTLVAQVRRRVECELGVPGSRILVTATHSHSGPPTIHLTGCGEYDPTYVAWFQERLLQAGREATAVPEPCELVVAQGTCDLAVDRRRCPTPHTDPRVVAIGWRRKDGTFKAVLLSYGMHAVCLSGTEISADWPGEAARMLAQELPGSPTVLVCTGACGNTNPPAVGVTPEQMHRWGRRVAASILPDLLRATTLSRNGKPLLAVASAEVPLEQEDHTADEIARHAARCLANPAGREEFGDKFAVAVEAWRMTMLERIRPNALSGLLGALTVVGLGPIVLTTVNAELFSRFNELIGPGDGRRSYAIGCTNGMLGYLPTSAAYQEGGYEVLWSMLFYNQPRPAPGSLERLAHRARTLMSRSFR